MSGPEFRRYRSKAFNWEGETLRDGFLCFDADHHHIDLTGEEVLAISRHPGKADEPCQLLLPESRLCADRRQIPGGADEHANL
jgi:hypothetical protein